MSNSSGASRISSNLDSSNIKTGNSLGHQRRISAVAAASPVPDFKGSLVGPMQGVAWLRGTMQDAECPICMERLPEQTSACRLGHSRASNGAPQLGADVAHLFAAAAALGPAG